MASIDRRLSLLEAKLPDDTFFENVLKLLPMLVADPLGEWAGTFLEELAATPSWVSARRLSSRTDLGLARLLDAATVGSDGLSQLERVRGIVPDRVVAAIYNSRRNHAGTSDEVVRVRQLAGVVDETGVPLPGYILHRNGCILDADTSASSLQTALSRY